VSHDVDAWGEAADALLNRVLAPRLDVIVGSTCLRAYDLCHCFNQVRAKVKQNRQSSFIIGYMD